jgi:hypothetical protein
MPTKIGIANALSSKDLAQVSRLLTANSKKSRFTPEERKQLEAHKNTLRKPRGKAASAVPNASAAASAVPNASANASANASVPASKAPASKAAESRAAGQMSRLANVQSRFSANGSYTGKTRKGNATKLKGLLALKKDPFDPETRSKVEKMLADLEAAPPKAPVLSAVAESNESNESSAKQYFDPTTGAPMEEEAFFKMLKDSGLCKEATKRNTAKKAKNKKSANRKALKKGRANFAKEYYSRKGPIGASLESQSASSGASS